MKHESQYLIDDIKAVREYYKFKLWINENYYSYKYSHDYSNKLKELPELVRILINSQGIIKPSQITVRLFKQILSNICIKHQPKFQMDESCEPTYDKVIMYIREDPTFLSLNHGHSFDKGLLICGRVGCGKTLLFKGLSDLMKIFKIRCEDREGYYRTFYSKSANVIVQEFSLNGFEIMRPFNPYNEEKDYGLINNHLFIDDLGTESLGFYYGAQRNVLGELLQIRYDNRNEYITHATSNLDPQALKSFYGERVFSRINEMFNYINMEGNDRRL